jgi:hypothetical protein
MTQPAPATRLDKLERLGRYRIVRPLSKGGMALVYEARRESLAGVAPRVAIKLILPDYAGSDAFQELFINEARLGASMHHQNLVQIQDFDRDGELFYLVMEYVEGLTLRRVASLCARHGLRMPMAVLAEIGRQACDGLHYAHAATDSEGRALDLVHRDMKPSNIILNPQGVVKILDFGISKGRLLAERKGAVKGTWGYMAPEQAAGHEVSPATDVFGLATVLYELAALRPMFDQRPPEDLKRLLNDDHAARMATQIDAEYGALVGILVRALQRDPRARYASAAELGRAIGALVPEPVTARDEVVRFYQQMEALDRGASASGLSRPPATGPSGGGVSTAAPASGPWMRSRWAWPVVGAGAALLVGAIVLGSGALSLAWRSGETSGAVAEAASEDRVASALPSVRPPPVSLERAAQRGGAAAPPAPRVDEARVTVNRRVVPEAEEPPAEVGPVEAAPPAVDVVTAPVSIAAVPGAFEVYIDGKLKSKGPLADALLPVGRHLVTITAADGRIKRFDLEVIPDKSIRRTWDFDRGAWRK